MSLKLATSNESLYFTDLLARTCYGFVLFLASYMKLATSDQSLCFAGAALAVVFWKGIQWIHFELGPRAAVSCPSSSVKLQSLTTGTDIVRDIGYSRRLENAS